MKKVFLASPFFTHFDMGRAKDCMVPVAVTDQCYNALKANDYLLSEKERLAYMRHCHMDGWFDRRYFYGGTDGFTFRELRGFTIFRAHEIRQWPEWDELERETKRRREFAAQVA